ncbi:hypothetical protein [Streptomyces sp. SID12501]|nr:hypothetical protein [Streptomyces sp. SID12501]
MHPRSLEELVRIAFPTAPEGVEQIELTELRQAMTGSTSRCGSAITGATP